MATTHPVTRRYRLAWLFDVDGTLLTTDGGARRAFTRAVSDTFGVEDALTDIPFAGRTEPLILADILAKHGRRFVDGEEQAFWSRVFDHARRLIAPPHGWLMPGVADLLDAVESEAGWVSGLLTGNMTQMAKIKLARFGIEDRFAFGAFGEMAPDRNALARLAVGRIGRDYGVPPERCVVVGDTEHDVACARSAGARAVAVATGSRTRDELERESPDLLLDDLSDPAPLLEWARALER
jgi:phosphoglycolate phosphatase-like HAD superfamily hydrolase